MAVSRLDRDAQPPRAGDQPLPAPAPRQPGGLVPVGRGGADPGARRGPPDPALGRLLRLPLVPRDGARVLRGPRHRRLHERALRQRQGRPRGAPRRRRPLHGGGAGDDRPRRLADDRLPRPRGRALLRRHLLPARRGPRDAELPDGDGSGGRRLRRKRDELRERAPQTRARLGAIGQVEPPPESPDGRLLDEAVGALRAGADLERGGFGGAPKFPPASALELLCSPAARARSSRQTLDAMLAGGIYDQVGGGFSRYSVDADWLVPHFEKMLYDNALLARAYLHGWQAPRPRALPPRLRGDARLGAARDARPRGRLLLRPRRRLRGRGGPLLRLDAGTDPGGPRRRRGGDHRLLRRHRGGQLRGPQHPPPRRGRRGARAPRPRRGAPRPLRGPRQAGLAGPRRQAPDLLERADDRGPGRGRRRPGPRRLPGRGPPLRRVHPRLPARPQRPPPAHLQGRQGPPQRLPRGPRLPARGAAHPLRIDLRAALVRRGPVAGRHDDRPLRRPRARRLLLNLQRPRSPDRPPQGDRRPPDPLGQLLSRLRPPPPRGPNRRPHLRATGRIRLPPLRQTRRPAPRGLRPPPQGPRLPPLPDQRGRPHGRRPNQAHQSHPLDIPTAPGPRRRPRGQRNARATPRNAPPSTAAPRPTSASTSPARPRSRTRSSSPIFSDA